MGMNNSIEDVCFVIFTDSVLGKLSVFPHRKYLCGYDRCFRVYLRTEFVKGDCMIKSDLKFVNS